MRTRLHHNPLHQLRVRLREETGVALVEFALVLPVLALILFGALDLGKAYNYWIDETHLAHEGARYAAVNKNPCPPPSASLLSCLRDQADTAELKNGGTGSVPSPLQVCVDFPNGTTNVGDPVRVQVTSTYRFMSFIAAKVNVLQKAVVANSTMRLERVPTYTADCA
jgi:TadE-like protein